VLSYVNPIFDWQEGVLSTIINLSNTPGGEYRILRNSLFIHKKD